MGRTLPSVTQVFLKEQESFLRFRRALRRSDQKALDDLFAAAHKHLAAAAYASHALPFEAFLLSMLLEEHKQVLRMRYLLSPSDAAALEQLERGDSTAYLDELSAQLEAVSPAPLPEAGEDAGAAAPDDPEKPQPPASSQDSTEAGATPPEAEATPPGQGGIPPDSGAWLINFHG
jgi:hypothetical protein